MVGTGGRHTSCSSGSSSGSGSFDFCCKCVSLRARRKHLEGEIFEILLTFTDFLVFKELILDYKAVRNMCLQLFNHSRQTSNTTLKCY